MADFALSAGRLTVSGELFDEAKIEFESHCAKLLESGPGELLLDMSGVDYMASCHLSVILQLHLSAGGRGKHLRAVVTPKIAELLDLGRLSEVLDARVTA